MNRLTWYQPQHSAKKRPTRARPALGRLEDRTVLSSYTASTVKQLIADINAANVAGGSNTITLKIGNTFNLEKADYKTDGANGLPVIAAGDNLTIVGNGDTITRSSSAKDFRLLEVAQGATLTFQNATLQGGLARGSDSAAYGGAILNEGTLTLTGMNVLSNVAQGQGATRNGLGMTFAMAGEGGGVYSSGSLILQGGTTISGNEAPGAKGPGSTFGGDGDGGGLCIVGGTATLSSVSISPNTAQGGDSGSYAGHGRGGGLCVQGGTVTLNGVTILSNTATGGQGQDAAGGWIMASAAYGGGVCARGGTVALVNCTLTSNSAAGGVIKSGGVGAAEGGGLYIDPSAVVCLDAYTFAHTTGNQPDDIYGSNSLTS